MSYRLLLKILFIFLTLSGYCQFDQSTLTRKKIKLISFENKPFVAYENLLKIIYLDKEFVIDNIKKHLENSKLCSLRRENYTKILNQLTENDKSAYVIMPANTSTQILPNGDIPSIDSIELYKILDSYSKYDNKFNLKNYKWPYGYEIEVDTTNLVHLDNFFDWMLSELATKGYAKIYNKQSKKYEHTIFFQFTPVLHGREDLLLHDKKVFFHLKTYSDILTNDIKCGVNYDCDDCYEIIE
jgi:hypothetical protein